MDSKTIDRLDELLDYVHHVGKLNQKPIFRIEEYKQLCIWEHELKGKIGIQHNNVDDDGVSIWLRIERLKRLSPPLIPEQIREWVAVGNDPENSPQIKDKWVHPEFLIMPFVWSQILHSFAHDRSACRVP